MSVCLSVCLPLLDNLLLKLHRLLTLPSTFGTGSYGQEIHEMTEMRALAMGQYGHNNQPVHHILYLFALLGQRSTMERSVRAVMDKAYGVEFYAGDEDNGEQGAWFVMSALGLFAAVPGTPGYVLGTPLFKHVRVQRGHGDAPHGTYGASTEAAGAPLDIVAVGTGALKAEVTEVYMGLEKLVLDGDACVPNCNLVDNSALMRGGVLRFVFEGERGADGVLPPLHLDSDQRATEAERLVAELQEQLKAARRESLPPYIAPAPDASRVRAAAGAGRTGKVPAAASTRSQINNSSFLLVLFTVFIVAMLVAKLLSSIGVMRSSSYFRKNKSKQNV